MKRSFVLFLLVIFVCPINSYAYPGGKGIKWWKDPKIVSELDLNTGQVDRIEGIFSSYRETITSLNSELADKEKELRSAIRNLDSTQEEILRLTDEVENVKGELRKTEVRMFLEIRDVLTPEQRDKLHKIKGRYGK